MIRIKHMGIVLVVMLATFVVSACAPQRDISAGDTVVPQDVEATAQDPELGFTITDTGEAILLLPYYSADQSTGIQQLSSGSGGESNTFVANSVVVICMPTE